MSSYTTPAPERPVKPAALEFVEIHFRHGGLEPYSFDILQRMVKIISGLGQMLRPLMEIKLIHWPADEPLLVKSRWFSNCLLQGCDEWNRHYKWRLDNAQAAEQKLPKFEFQGDPDPQVLYQFTKTWAETLKGLHDVTHNDRRMWLLIIEHFEESVYHDFLELHNRDPAHAVWDALHEQFMKISLGLQDLVTLVSDADTAVDRLDEHFDGAKAKYNIKVPEKHMRRTNSEIVPFITKEGRRLLAKEEMKREARERLEAMQELPRIDEGSSQEAGEDFKILGTPGTSFGDSSLASSPPPSAGSASSDLLWGLSSAAGGAGDRGGWKSPQDILSRTSPMMLPELRPLSPIQLHGLSLSDDPLALKKTVSAPPAASDADNPSQRRLEKQPAWMSSKSRSWPSLQGQMVSFGLPHALPEVENQRSTAAAPSKSMAATRFATSPQSSDFPSPAAFLKSSNARPSNETDWEEREVSGETAQLRRPPKGTAVSKSVGSQGTETPSPQRKNTI